MNILSVLYALKKRNPLRFTIIFKQIMDRSKESDSAYDYTSGCFDKIDPTCFATVTSRGRFCFYDIRDPSSKGSTTQTHSLHDADLTKTHKDLTDFTSIKASPAGGEFALGNASEKVFLLERRKEEGPKGHSLRLSATLVGPTVREGGNGSLPYEDTDIESFCPDFFGAHGAASRIRDTTKSDASQIECWELNDFCYSANGTSIIFGYHNGVVAQYRRRSATLQGLPSAAQHSSGDCAVRAKGPSFLAHRSGVACVTADSRGEMFASSGFDSTVAIWQGSGFASTKLNTFLAGARPVSCMSFSHDSKILACGFGPPSSPASSGWGGERLRLDHWHATGNTNFLNGLVAGTSAFSVAEDIRSNKLYSRDLVFMNPQSGHIFSRDELRLPGNVGVMAWHPTRQVLAFGMSDFSSNGGGGSAGAVPGAIGGRGQGSDLARDTLVGGMVQLVKIPDTSELGGGEARA